MNPPSHDQQRKTAVPVDGSVIVSLARQTLESHPHFHHRSQLIRVEWVEQNLVLSGRVPSFYLKQLAQEAMRGLEVTVINQIDVVCSDG